MRARAALLALVLGACAACAETADPSRPPEPAGFWTGPMQGAVPATIAGGEVVTTDELIALIGDETVVLVDVGPAPHKPDNIAANAWMPPPHRSIPGSAWLPGVGAGELSPAVDHWFRARLDALTDGDRARPLVLYCHPNCWGSWNAAKRAILYGYTDVYWYEEGVEGWQDAGQPTAVTTADMPPS